MLTVQRTEVRSLHTRSLLLDQCCYYGLLTLANIESETDTDSMKSYWQWVSVSVNTSVQFHTSHYFSGSMSHSISPSVNTSLVVYLHSPTPRPIQKQIKNGLHRIVWCSYCTEKDTCTDSHWILCKFISICLGLCVCLGIGHSTAPGATLYLGATLYYI